MRRRTMIALAGGALAAAGLPRAAHAYATNNIGLPVIPLRLTNLAGAGRALYVSIIGTTQPANPAGNWFFVSDAHGNVTRCTPSSAAVSLSIQGPTGNGAAALHFPYLSAVRIYVSLDRPLLVTVDASGSPSAPAGWVPTDPNFSTLFDWAELTWDGPVGNTTLGGNTTQVDMFGLPLKLELDGFDAHGNALSLAAGFGAASAYANILRALAFAPAPWSSLVLKNAGGTAIRAISPYHGIELGMFPSQFLDGYIAKVFNRYRTATLSTTAQGIAYGGQVSEGNFVFTPAGGGTAVTFAQPSTYETFTSGPLPTVASAAGGVIGAALRLRSCARRCC